jgi:20S proteasome alpha/beta subunit
MTLIVALKYKNGSILSTDTRLMYGFDIKIDQMGKIKFLTENIGVAISGLAGAADDILKSAKDFCNSRPTSFDDVCSCLSDKSLEWFEKNAWSNLMNFK